MFDPSSQTFGLPPSVLIPIAARSIAALETYVGRIVEEKRGRDGGMKGLLVEPFTIPEVTSDPIQLWKEKNAEMHFDRLHPNRQVWVHVNYRAYRKVYFAFGMPDIPRGYFLDHVQNREAVRLKGYSHPYLRLCPVSHKVNTSGGHTSGGEGMEKEFLRRLATMPVAVRDAFEAANACQIVYADPMDLCKMGLVKFFVSRHQGT